MSARVKAQERECTRCKRPFAPRGRCRLCPRCGGRRQGEWALQAPPGQEGRIELYAARVAAGQPIFQPRRRAMLTVARKVGERVVILLPDGRRVEVVVADLTPYRAQIGIEAPPDVKVVRKELLEGERGD